AMSIRGVGAANLAGGVANVYFERWPLVGICEALPVAAEPGESVQQCDQAQLFSGVSRYQATLSKERAQEMIREAFCTAVSGRPIPSMLHLPAGLGDVDDYSPSQKTQATPSSEIDDASLQKAKDFISRYKRLAVVAGADVIRGVATRELHTLV